MMGILDIIFVSLVAYLISLVFAAVNAGEYTCGGRMWLFFVPLANIISALYIRHKELKVRRLYFLIRDLGGDSIPDEYKDAYAAIRQLYDVDALEEAYSVYLSREDDKSQEKVLSKYL
jgi:hypothetical protein